MQKTILRMLLIIIGANFLCACGSVYDVGEDLKYRIVSPYSKNEVKAMEHDS